MSNEALREQIAQAVHSFLFADGSADASDYQIADAVLPVVQAHEKALRHEIADQLLTHVGGDENDAWQAGHNYAMREASRLIREGAR